LLSAAKCGKTGLVDERKPIKVLLVDDDPGFLEALEALFTRDERFEIVGTARDGAEALSLAISLQPDVVTMDIEMPRMDGVEATRQIRAEVASTRVVILSSSAYASRAETAREAGASAYVSKSVVADELLPTVAAVAEGDDFAESELAPTLRAEARRRGAPEDAPCREVERA
jgi:DNA-binding NarL/FixJ family response regulator